MNKQEQVEKMTTYMAKYCRTISFRNWMSWQPKRQNRWLKPSMKP